MAINYTWDCKTVDVKNIEGNEDTVFNVHWKLTGTDDTNGDPKAASLYGLVALDISDLSNFTAFADLTKSDVQGWVETALGENKITEMKDSLNLIIAELIKPTQQTKTIGE